MAKFVLYNYKTPLLRAGQELASDPSTNPSTVKQLYGLAVVPLKAYQQILDEGIKSGEFYMKNVEGSCLLLGSWLGGLCQFIHSIEMEKLEVLFEEAIKIFYSLFQTNLCSVTRELERLFKSLHSSVFIICINNRRLFIWMSKNRNYNWRRFWYW